MQTTAPAIIAPGIGCSRTFLRNVLTRVGGSRRGETRPSCTFTQFVTTLLPITVSFLQSHRLASLEYGWRSRKKGQGGCHEQYRKGMINRKSPHIAGCLRAGVGRHLEHLLLLALPPTHWILCRLKRTAVPVPASSDGLSALLLILRGA